MRRPNGKTVSLILLLAAVAVCSDGCLKPAPQSTPGKISADPAEIGRPWPVLIQGFDGPLVALEHDADAFVFQAGRRNPVLYRLDYEKRELTRIAERPSAKTPDSLGRVESGNQSGENVLLLRLPSGDSRDISRTLLSTGENQYAQTDDLTGVAFYESLDTGAQLVYFDQTSGTRYVWRRLSSPPTNARLSWSSDGRFLLEEAGGQIIVHVRDNGRITGSAAGNGAVFSPAGTSVAYWRTDGRPGLLDTAAGADRILAPKGATTPYLPNLVWASDGSRLFFQAGHATGGEPDRPEAATLYVYLAGDRTVRTFSLPAAIDLSRYAPLLQADPPYLASMVELLPKLGNGPLAALDQGGCLLGQDNRLMRVSLKASLYTLQSFPENIIDLSLAKGTGRLAIITGTPDKPSLYAWHLPDPDVLTGAFPDERDLFLGGVELGMNDTNVKRKLGPVLSEETGLSTTGSGKQLLTLYFDGASATFDSGRLVKAIFSAPGIATPRGVALGSTMQDVYERYGRPYYSSADYLSYQGKVGQSTLKIAFTFDTQNRVSAILVSYPEEN